MKVRALFCAFIFILMIQSCSECNKKPHGGGNTYLEYIPIDSANKMIGSYLNSINSQQNDSDLHSVIFDADCLRDYLKDNNVSKIKIMFAHTLEYINNGGQDQNVGYEAGKLTFVLAGFDRYGDYVFSLQDTIRSVMNHGTACPTICPRDGSASNDLLRL
jgi:hypothetical protein